MLILVYKKNNFKRIKVEKKLLWATSKKSELERKWEAGTLMGCWEGVLTCNLPHYFQRSVWGKILWLLQTSHVLTPHLLSLRRSSLFPLSFRGGARRQVCTNGITRDVQWAMVLGTGDLGGGDTVALSLLLCRVASLGWMLCFPSMCQGGKMGWGCPCLGEAAILGRPNKMCWASF